MSDQKRRNLPRADLLIRGAAEILTCLPAGNDPSGRQVGRAIAVKDEHILAVAPIEQLDRLVDLSTAGVVDATGMIVAPGFVDCHTHLVFGGSRAREYGLSMTHSHAEIKALGVPAGILATVDMTRAESAGQLTESAERRLWRMMRNGTTTVESKSGYGLSLEQELKMLAVNQRLQTLHPLDVVSTFLGAHDFPQDMSRESYLALVIEQMIPQVAERELAVFCDVYCDDGYYTVDESRRILEAGRQAGLAPKIHTDAYSDIGGATMAAELGVVSADHLNYTGPEAIEKLAAAGVVAVLMPGLDFAVRHPRPFNARAMLDAGLTVALATDFCPGCWLESMQLVMALACRLYGFSPQEALHAATAGGAQALALSDRGVIAAGKLADLQIWDASGLDEVIYRLGDNAVRTVIKRGKAYQVDSPMPSLIPTAA